MAGFQTGAEEFGVRPATSCAQVRGDQPDKWSTAAVPRSRLHWRAWGGIAPRNSRRPAAFPGEETVEGVANRLVLGRGRSNKEDRTRLLATTASPAVGLCATDGSLFGGRAQRGPGGEDHSGTSVAFEGGQSRRHSGTYRETTSQSSPRALGTTDPARGRSTKTSTPTRPPRSFRPGRRRLQGRS